MYNCQSAFISKLVVTGIDSRSRFVAYVKGVSHGEFWIFFRIVHLPYYSDMDSI